MSDQFFDAIAVRTVTSLSRRGSLIGLGGAALAATLAHPSPANAGKAGKRAKKTCKRQIDKCQSSVIAFCAQPNLAVEREECEAAVVPCCSSFKRCKAGAAYDCIGDALLALAPPTPS